MVPHWRDFSELSKSTRRVAGEAVKAAHNAGTIVSYDLNFRSKLWSSKEAIGNDTAVDSLYRLLDRQ